MTFQGVKKIKTKNNIYDFWEDQGKIRGNTLFATLRDHYFRYIEIKSIVKEIKSKKNCLLDVGCGNGVSTFFFSPYAKKTVGLDFSKNLIDNAKKFQRKKNFKNLINKCNFKDLKSDRKNIIFKQGNILDLAEYENQFDLVICSRVLVNMVSKNDQYIALEKLHKVLKTNSLLFINEAEKTCHQKLSLLRKKNGLNPLESYWHNTYLEEKNFLKKANKIGFKLIKKIKYGEYQILSKVIYPKILDLENPSFLSNFNKFSAELFLKNRKKARKLIDIFLCDQKFIKNKDSISHQIGYIFKKK